MSEEGQRRVSLVRIEPLYVAREGDADRIGAGNLHFAR